MIRKTSKIALISVFDKVNVVDFAKKLQKIYGYTLISTGKTHDLLSKKGLNVEKVSDVTGFPEILDGRVKTLHPRIFGGVLADLKNPEHKTQLKKLNINPISMVVVNLYPFEKTVKTDASLKEAIEQIDIGGVSLIRAAAKNFSNVIVICDPSDYEFVINELGRGNGKVPLAVRKKLAAKAFERTFVYDLAISRYLNEGLGQFGNSFVQEFSKVQDLRYGENPHQKAAFYSKSNDDPLSISKFRQIQGKELSFNNFLDIDATINSLSYFDSKRACAVVVKHTNPCGAAYGVNVYEAFEKAWNGDPLAAFGGIVGVNRKVDEKLAKQMVSKGFFEVLVCPEISDKAKEVFKEKKNLRIMVNPALLNGIVSSENDFKHVRGGLLLQSGDTLKLRKANLKAATKSKPTTKQVKDMLFAWQVARVSKSNTIVLVKDEALVASGVGQQDRKRCCELATSKAGERAKGCVCASDAFFPFADGPEILIKAGVKAIIQPGGSIRDQETVDLCDRHQITMVFTGIRAFKH